MNERLWELLAKYWSDRISPEEKVEMESLLLEHPDHWLKTGLMQQISWKPEQMFSPKQADRIADRIVGEGQERSAPFHGRRKFPRVRYWRLAFVAGGILLVATFILVLYRNYQKLAAGRWQQVTTMDGMKTTMRLADGSELWLNAASSLRYPASFNEQTREVYLTGEAFFKIAPNASKPFLVHTPHMDIRVLGTAFNVRAYPDDPFSETSLISGAVEVVINRGGQKQQVYLKPAQKILVRPFVSEPAESEAAGERTSPPGGVGRDVVLEPVHPLDGGLTAETAWKDNTFWFGDEPLGSLAKRIERWYGVKVLIRDSVLAGYRFSGRADNLPLEGLLQMLEQSHPFSYEAGDREVVIH